MLQMRSNRLRWAGGRALVVSALLAGSSVLAEGFNPERLLLTWQRDPTTTMTVQWLELGQLLPVVADGPATPVVFDVPHVGDAAVDAGGGWWDRGLVMAFLADSEHQLTAPERLTAQARLGWNERGLRLLVKVTSPVALEHENIDRLWDSDSIEAFVLDAVGSDHRYQVVVSPGWDEDHAEPRHRFYVPSGGPKVEDLSVETASQVNADRGGYTLEILLPWSNLERIEPREGTTIGFQFYVNDRMGPGGDGWTRVGLHANPNASSDASAAYTFRLAREASQPIRARADVAVEDDQAVVRFHGVAELAGERVSLFSGARALAEAVFELQEDVARAVVPVPAAPEGQRWGPLEARLDQTPIATLAIPEWLGQLPADPVAVEYWAVGSQTRQTAMTEASPIAYWPGKFRQRVELTGLQPDTEYRFQATGHPEDYGFRTMPAQLTEPLRVAIGGDTRHNQQWMEQVNRVAMAHQPHVIVWGGDLAYADGRQDRLYRWREWFDANYKTLIDEQRRVMPIVVGIGNHEVQRGYYFGHNDYEPTDAWRQRVAPYFYQLFAFPGHPGYNVLDFGNYMSLIILDSDHSAPVEGEQTQWLEQVLAQRQHVPHFFPVYHVPAWPSHRAFDGRTSVRVREHWVPLFERYGVRLAFENHDHTYKRTVPIRDGQAAPTGIVYFGDGAWGVGERPVHDPAETWYLERAESMRHCIIVTLHSSHQEVAVYSREGELLDAYTTAPAEAAQAQPNP